MARKQTRSRFTEDWLTLKDINNGMIVLKNNERVCGVKIVPRNIFILSEDSQVNILIALKNFYNLLDFEFWLVVADRPVDISVYMSSLQLLHNSTSDPAIRKLISQDIQKGNAFVTNNVVDTEYFILFKEKNMDNLQKKVRLLISGLSSAGLTATQTTNDDMRVILENFLNGGRTTEFGTVNI